MILPIFSASPCLPFQDSIPSTCCSLLPIVYHISESTAHCKGSLQTKYLSCRKFVLFPLTFLSSQQIPTAMEHWFRAICPLLELHQRQQWGLPQQKLWIRRMHSTFRRALTAQQHMTGCRQSTASPNNYAAIVQADLTALGL